MTVRFVRGPRRWWLIVTLFARVALAGARRLGAVRLLRELRAYLRANDNLLAGSADRFVERDGSTPPPPCPR